MKLLLWLSMCVSGMFVHAQNYFQPAYSQYTHVTPGVLEAVAWTHTHMVHLGEYTPSCSGLPQAYGIMGLYDDGKDYFIENGELVAEISGISVEQQKASPVSQILAFAHCYDLFMQQEIQNGGNMYDGKSIRNVLFQLTEIPDSGAGNQYARDAMVYSVLTFMKSQEEGNKYGFVPLTLKLSDVFGDNYAVLSSKKVSIASTEITGDHGAQYLVSNARSTEYGPAIWNPADPCNFSSRGTATVSAITIHTIQGYYGAAISWAQNCASSVSYHYVIRSNDGQVTQMVLEADKAWHVGSENAYTIGYEHEGYVTDSTWYTQVMYESSADLSRDIINSGYGISGLRTYYGPATTGTNLLGSCIRIKGHQHYPNQSHTDPGVYWKWEKYYKLINNNPNTITVSSTSGSLYDSGGPTGNYQDDERQLWLIQPPSTQSITLTFSAFDLELDYDKMFIYDGDNTDAPIIGIYTGTNSPGTVTSSSGSLLLEFRSDCGIVAPGWIANFTSIQLDQNPPTTSIQPGSIWYSDDFTVNYTDTDPESGIAEKYYLVGNKSVTMNGWTADNNYFLHQDFEDNTIGWTNAVGTYSLSGNSFVFSDINEQNSNAHHAFTQNGSQSYLFEWDQMITSNSTNQRAGLHFFCDNPNLPNRGNSYFVYLRENGDLVQIYRVTNDVFNLEVSEALAITSNTWNNCKVTYDPSTGWLRVFVDGNFIAEWQDPNPLQSGNSVSFRTGGCSAVFDNLRIYQSRGNSTLVTAGFSDQMPYESEGAQPTGLVRSIVLDQADNWSIAAIENYLLDFSAPVLQEINDGLTSDIDTIYTPTVEGNWNFIDIHSGVEEYEVAIGIYPNLNDVMDWTNISVQSTISHILQNPVYDTTYLISVRGKNSAGLWSSDVTSDGQYLVDTTNNSVGISDLLSLVRVYPNPVSDYLQLELPDSPSRVILYDAYGKIVEEKILSGTATIDIQTYSEGKYIVSISIGNQAIVVPIVILH